MPRPRSNSSKKLRKIKVIPAKTKIHKSVTPDLIRGLLDRFRVKPGMTVNTGKWLIVLGVALLIFPLAYKNRVRYSSSQPKNIFTQNIATSSAQAANPIKIDPKLQSAIEPVQPPMRVVIPGLSLDLPIVEAKVNNGYWELSQTTASHGIGSANPGENGNIVVFAHARDELFGPLRKIKKDDQIYLLTKDRWYKYQVSETKEVDPNDTQVIAPTQSETLTLYTCSGFLDGKRLIVSAQPFKT